MLCCSKYFTIVWFKYHRMCTVSEFEKKIISRFVFILFFFLNNIYHFGVRICVCVSTCVCVWYLVIRNDTFCWWFILCKFVNGDCRLFIWYDMILSEWFRRFNSSFPDFVFAFFFPKFMWLSVLCWFGLVAPWIYTRIDYLDENVTDLFCLFFLFLFAGLFCFFFFALWINVEWKRTIERERQWLLTMVCWLKNQCKQFKLNTNLMCGRNRQTKTLIWLHFILFTSKYNPNIWFGLHKNYIVQIGKVKLAFEMHFNLIQ